MPEGDVNCDILIYNPSLPCAKFQIPGFFSPCHENEGKCQEFFCDGKVAKAKTASSLHSAALQLTSALTAAARPLHTVRFGKFRASTEQNQVEEKEEIREVANCLFSALVLC